MKIKTLLSILILAFFAIIGGGSKEEDSLTIGVILSVICIIICIAGAIYKVKSDQEEKEKKRMDLIRQLEEKSKQEDCYKNQKLMFISRNGNPDKTIIIKENDINSEINVYINTKLVFILGKQYKFGDILSCTYDDNKTTIKGKISSVTDSGTGSTIGRAVVGGVIAGPAGAIIGGTTSSKYTRYTQEDDKIIHDYTVLINVNSISEPIIRINTGEDGKLTNDIVGLMNVIIRRK